MVSSSIGVRITLGVGGDYENLDALVHDTKQMISGVLVVWLSRTPRGDWKTAMPLGLIVGGALGNLIDRLHASQVTDFIHVYFRQWNYPVFNLADCGITVGAVMLVVFGLFQGKAKA